MGGQGGPPLRIYVSNSAVKTVKTWVLKAMTVSSLYRGVLKGNQHYYSDINNLIN